MKLGKHIEGCNPWDCVCHLVDARLRLSPKAQVDAIYEADNYFYMIRNDDPESDWIVYLESIGWTTSQIYSWKGRNAR